MKHTKTAPIAFALMLSLYSANPAHAQGAGSGSGNGGGGEFIFRNQSQFIKSWLNRHEQAGTLSAKLHLDEAGYTAGQVVQGYEDALAKARVKFIPKDKLEAECTQNNDPYACRLRDTSRTCVNDTTADFSVIECNEDLFKAKRGDEQYALTFHEYLGIAGIEVDQGPVELKFSECPISQYLIRYVNPRTVIVWELGDEAQEVNTLTVSSDVRLADLEKKLSSCRGDLMKQVLRSMVRVAEPGVRKRKIDFRGRRAIYFKFTIHHGWIPTHIEKFLQNDSRVISEKDRELDQLSLQATPGSTSIFNRLVWNDDNEPALKSEDKFDASNRFTPVDLPKVTYNSGIAPPTYNGLGVKNSPFALATDIQLTLPATLKKVYPVNLSTGQRAQFHVDVKAYARCLKRAVR